MDEFRVGDWVIERGAADDKVAFGPIIGMANGRLEIEWIGLRRGDDVATTRLLWGPLRGHRERQGVRKMREDEVTRG